MSTKQEFNLEIFAEVTVSGVYRLLVILFHDDYNGLDFRCDV